MRLFDGDGLEIDAQPLGQRFRRRPREPSLKSRDGMEMPCTPGRTKGVNGDGGHQRRFDAARQADHRFGEAVLSEIVAGTEHRRGVDLGVVAQGEAGAAGVSAR